MKELRIYQNINFGDAIPMSAFWESLTKKPTGEKITIVQMGVLVCMAMDKLPGRAPRAPSALTAPAQPLHALPGSQIPSSASLQLHTALPFPA